MMNTSLQVSTNYFGSYNIHQIQAAGSNKKENSDSDFGFEGNSKGSEFDLKFEILWVPVPGALLQRNLAM